MRISDWSSDVCSSDLHDGCGFGMLAQVQYLLAQVGVSHIIAAVAAPADRVGGPAQPIFAAMLVDDRQPALVDELVQSGRGRSRGAGRGIEAARLEEHTSELQSLMRNT